MANIEIEFYEKTRSHCPNCMYMKAALRRWIEQNGGKDDVKVFSLSLEDNRDKVIAENPDAKAAPAVKITRGKDVNWVTGNNPDIMVDYLNGDSDIWDDAPASPRGI